METRSIKILAVDDDILILMNTAAQLEDMGHVVVEAQDGRVALQALSEHGDIDLLITDQTMPGMNGSELIERVAERHPGLPVILATGYGDLDGAAVRPTVILGKPFNERELKAAVAEAMGFGG